MDCQEKKFLDIEMFKESKASEVLAFAANAAHGPRLWEI
jgi:hypothetical protein